jgi:hypothetical protein
LDFRPIGFDCEYELCAVIEGFPKFFHFIEVGTDEAEQLPLYV